MPTIDLTFEGPITDPALADKLVARTLDYLSHALSASMPTLRRKVPYDTGVLRRSLVIAYDRRKGVVRIGFRDAGFYWRYQRGLRRELSRVFFTTIRSNQQDSFNKAIADSIP